jgi:hypothetical protein
VTLDFLHVAAFIVIFGFIWRLLSLQLAGTKIGQGMSFIY